MRVVAVFGGGGAKAVAHVGAQRALVEAGLRPIHYAATSFGAVMAAALAAGRTADALAAELLGANPGGITPIDLLSFIKGIFADHLIKPDPLRALIARLVPATFAELGTPLTVTATDLDSGELVLFGAGGRGDVGLREALYASCALPLYYPPARIDGRRFIDGGVRAVLPLEAVRGIPADLVVAIHVGPGFDEPPAPSMASHRLAPGLVRAHGEAERIMMAAQVERTIADWPRDAARLVVVRPVREREATFAVENATRYLEAGYQATKEALKTDSSQ